MKLKLSTVAKRSSILIPTLISALCSLLAQGQVQTDWWKGAVIYEIYPRSFGDTNGDGIGDIRGVIEHLDYLHDLGVNAIWLTPFYPSPQVDFGYDISNYTAMDPQYGTMADFDSLVAETKKRDMRVIVDLVLNHTSDKHPWFIESAKSRDSPKANWYMWHDPKPNGAPPNNWQSVFGHSAWQWVPARKQFYYHDFYTQQPDLNWSNPEVHQAMWDAVRFWLKRGASGFRLDAITTLFEDEKLRDNPEAGGLNAYGDKTLETKYTDNLPEVHNVLKELRKVCDEFPGSVLIGETYLPSVHDLLNMYGKNNDELHLPMDTQVGFLNKLSVPLFREKLGDAELRLNGNMPLLVFDNHDNTRAWNRYGDGQHNDEIARLIGLMLFTPRATSLMYYGQELGMTNNDPKRKEDVKDPIGIIGWPKEKGRDGERTPMQWNTETNAGFSPAANTWLPVNPNYKTRNVQVESEDPNSMLNFFKKLIALHKENSALRDGDFAFLDEKNDNVLSYARRVENGHAVIVALNFTNSPQKSTFRLTDAGAKGKQTKMLLSSSGASDALQAGSGNSDERTVTLPPFGYYVGEAQ